MTSNWLSDFLQEAVRRRLCTQIQCTTCGAIKFRRGVRAALIKALGPMGTEREATLEIARALSRIPPEDSESTGLQPAVMCLLFDLWTGIPILDREIETALGNSWARNVLRSMQEHYAAREAARQSREELEDPVNVQRRREEKRRLKQEQHQRRLALKKERDRVWKDLHRTTSGPE